MGKYFGTDGFRGQAGVSLTAAHARRIGEFLAAAGPNGGRVRVVIGKDTRRSGYMLEAALTAGLTAAGADVANAHVITTPGLAWLVRQGKFDYGVMLSASHNPYADNGIKLLGPDGGKLPQALEDAAEAYLDGERDAPYAQGAQIGSVTDHAAGRDAYMAWLQSLCEKPLDGLRIGLDCANGSAWQIAPALFRALGATVYPIHAAPDGFNINAGCGSTHMRDLQQLVLTEKLDLGFAFDGDADRCLAVDGRGSIVNGDHLMYIFATALKAAGLLPTNTVVTTVMSNLGLFQALKAVGINTVQTAVGDKYVYEAMVAGGHCVGGEQSGHIILSRHAATGDGLLTAVQLLNVLLDARVPLSELAAPVRMYPQLTRNVPVTDKAAVLANGAVADAVAAVSRQLAGTGRILLRPSGTEPVVRVMVECVDQAICAASADRVVSVMKQEGLA